MNGEIKTQARSNKDRDCFRAGMLRYPWALISIALHTRHTPNDNSIANVLTLARSSNVASLCINARRITGPPRGREGPNLDMYTYLAAVSESITHYDTA